MLEPGTKVEDKRNGKKAMVVFPLPGTCQDGEALLEYDGIAGCKAISEERLKALEKIQVETREGCQGCAFLRPEGKKCVRWTSERWGFLFGTTKRVPLRFYPHCQEEAG